MSLSAAEIERVTAELAPLEGGRVQKIWVPAPRVAVFEVRARGESHLLLVSALPDETRIHRASGRPASPPTPLAFQGLLRAHLDPARLVALRALPGERIVRMEFETPSGPRTLVAELLGRHGNLLFLGPEDRILGLAQPSPSTTRPLRPGVIYAPPPPRAASEAPPRFAPKEGEPFSISRAIEAHYTPLSLEREGREARREARRLVEQARRRAESALEKVEREAARARDADELLRMGELLKTALGRVQRGHAFVEATEYGEGGPRVVRIPLRPELSPKENLERYFKEYRRMVAARARIAERLEELRSARARAEELLARLDAAETPDAVEAVLDEARRLGRRGAGVAKAPVDRTERLPYRKFLSATGRPIWVGRGAKDNDVLTFRLARGNDLWLHARGVPGAHVVVPLQGGQPADAETFLDACALAAHFSRARDEAVAEIASTRVKHLRKPRGGAPGAAIVTQEKTTLYRHDPNRIERLLRSEAV